MPEKVHKCLCLDCVSNDTGFEGFCEEHWDQLHQSHRILLSRSFNYPEFWNKKATDECMLAVREAQIHLVLIHQKKVPEYLQQNRDVYYRRIYSIK